MWNFNRRRCLQSLLGGITGAGASGWLTPMARALAAENEKPNGARTKQNVILLWMTGGPSQLDTFDLKPEHENGGEFKPIDTNVPGIQISEHLPKLAQQADKLAIVRSLSTKEGDHERGTYLVHTGHRPGSPLDYPSICASLSKELTGAENSLPNFISVGGDLLNFNLNIGSGYLGPSYAPLSVRAQQTGNATDGATENNENSTTATFPSFQVEDLALAGGIESKQHTKRTALWKTLQNDFYSKQGNSASLKAHQTVYQRAMSMMNGPAGETFDLSQEPEELRLAYGRGEFGQSCLLARRLIEAGVSVVEIPFSLSTEGRIGWDTHADNFNGVKSLSGELDAGWTTLMTDLEQRGLLETTTILWIGEFGRTPIINQNTGRDHFAQAWSCVFAGGGISGGQAYGATNDAGMEVTEDKVQIGDVLSTLCEAAQVAPETMNESNLSRPIQIAEGEAISALLK